MAESIVSLRRRKDDLIAQSRDISKRIKFDKSQVDSLNARIAQIHAQIEANTEELVVSDHALLRYLERALEIDIDTAKQALMKEIVPYSSTLGDGSYTLPCGSTAIVKGNVVVTITIKDV